MRTQAEVIALARAAQHLTTIARDKAIDRLNKLYEIGYKQGLVDGAIEAWDNGIGALEEEIEVERYRRQLFDEGTES